MRATSLRMGMSVAAAVWVAVASLAFGEVHLLQVEYDYPAGGDIQYAPVNFAGSLTKTSDGIDYYALSTPGSPTVSTKSDHAYIVDYFMRLADGPNNPVTDVWCLYSQDYQNNYVKTSTASQYAVPPETFGNGIKLINHSWVSNYSTTAMNIDAVRRMDYTIWKQDILMVSGAVSEPGAPRPLNWTSYNGIAVRGTQGFVPSHGDGIGKTHADLWGPKTASGSDTYASYETPGVTGYAAALIDVADANGWSNGTNGLRHEVLKSILMSGASKTDFSTNGFTSWTSNGVNNLDDANGAGRVNYSSSLNILTSGPKELFSVANGVVGSTQTIHDSAGWWYEDGISAGGSQALVLNLYDSVVNGLTATLCWDVTQTETTRYNQPRIDTRDEGVIFANLDLELFPVTFDGSSYTLGSSLGNAQLFSKSTDDNVEHLYFTGQLDPGYYAFVVSNNSSFSWNYGFSFTTNIQQVRQVGDTNGDHIVDINDLGDLLANYGQSGKDWAQGDFNGDHIVDITDLGDLLANYGGNFNLQTFVPMNSVPEPSTLVLLLVFSACICYIRRPWATKAGQRP